VGDIPTVAVNGTVAVSPAVGVSAGVRERSAVGVNVGNAPRVAVREFVGEIVGVAVNVLELTATVRVAVGVKVRVLVGVVVACKSGACVLSEALEKDAPQTSAAMQVRMGKIDFITEQSLVV
jgi:hypothetical protein